LNLVEQLPDLGTAGVFQLSESAAAIEDAAAELGFAAWQIDCSGVASKEGLLRAIAETLGFPDWFGENWDALEDCLTDLSWREAPGYVLVLDHCGPLSRTNPEAFETALEIFDSAAEYWYDEEVPFWVFVGGADAEQFDVPPLGAE
jgi:RNAse (barnase) inhibitor barstar